MQISSRLAIAIHIFACIDVFKDDYKITSDFLASSVNVNPVIIRRTLQQLKNAELVDVQRGSGGASASKPLDKITVFDVYKAVDCIEEGELFRLNASPNPNCPVGRNINTVLNEQLGTIQNRMENEMKKITIADMVKNTKNLIESESE